MGTKREKLCGATLRSWRKRMGGYSIREASAVIGCDRESWSNWENDRRRIPRYIGLAMDALALGLKPYEDERAKTINAKRDV